MAYRRNFHSIGSATVSAHQQACTAPRVVAFYRKIRIPDNSAVFRIQKTRQFREICIGTMDALRAAANAWIQGDWKMKIERRTKMPCRMIFFVLVGLLIGASPASAGNIYKVTSQDGEKTITYEVRFGGGRLMDQFTAFNPETKKFVYLQWKRSDEKPAPAMKVWDHRTGEIILLYRFPDAKNPLPVIPSIDAMKVCPLTNDKNFNAKLHSIFD